MKCSVSPTNFPEKFNNSEQDVSSMLDWKGQRYWAVLLPFYIFVAIVTFLGTVGVIVGKRANFQVE